MNVKVRNLQVDAEIAELLEARAAARGLSVSELLADLAAADEALPPALESMRQSMRLAGTGPWSPEVLAEDARRLAEFKRTRKGVPWDEVEAWMKTWGAPDELPAPKPRNL